MAQFDVYNNKNPRSKKWTPFLLDIQSEILEELATRVVVPLRPYEKEKERVITKLHPVIGIEGKQYVAVVSELAAISWSNLDSPVSSIREMRQEIIDALDLIFTGF